MINLKLFLLGAAIVCFVLAAFAVKGPKGGWTPLGFAFVTAFFWPAA